MRIKINNVERDVSDEVGKEMVANKKAIEIPGTSEKEKDISKLKVDELKALAKERGIESVDSLKKEELLAILKDVV